MKSCAKAGNDEGGAEGFIKATRSDNDEIGGGESV